MQPDPVCQIGHGHIERHDGAEWFAPDPIICQTCALMAVVKIVEVVMFTDFWTQVAICALMQYIRERGSLVGVYGFNPFDGHQL